MRVDEWVIAVAPAVTAVAVVVSLAFALPAVMAQSSALPSVAASAPRPAKPVRLPARPLTPAELRESSSPTIDDRREGTATPQLSIPLGKTAPAQLKPAARPARIAAAAAAAASGIDDRAARCEAQADASARAACLRAR